jgi:CheY-like chemotaxis protein
MTAGWPKPGSIKRRAGILRCEQFWTIMSPRTRKHPAGARREAVAHSGDIRNLLRNDSSSPQLAVESPKRIPWGERMLGKDGLKMPAVLIVEDEPLIRMGAVEIIEDAGFEVIEAPGADEAVRILECRSDIRVVFTDIHMPGSMDGLKLAHAIRHRWPPIRIIVTSGRGLIAQRDLPEGGRFFVKPYNSIQITDALRAWAL